MSPLLLTKEGGANPDPVPDLWSYRIAVRVLNEIPDLNARDTAFLHVAAATAIQGQLSPRQTERLNRLAERIGIPI